MVAAPLTWQFGTHTLVFGSRPLVVGIVNITPDSFSDGGQFFSTQSAIEHGLRLVSEGADFLDIGGESSRPGALPVPLDEELARVVPVVRELAKQTSIPISVDTTKAEVAHQALAAGASIINDITALRGDPEMPTVVRDNRAGLVLMHMQGTPATMQDKPHYDDIAKDVCEFLAERLSYAIAAGIDRTAIVLDPGIGFGMTVAHTHELLRRLHELNALGRPIYLGVSRKGFIGEATGRLRPERVIGSIATACYCSARGAAHLWRVHDVAASVEAAKMLEALG